jgi:hypothetical protein
MHNILKYFFKFKNKFKNKNNFKNQGQLFSLRSEVSLLRRRFLASAERQNQVQVQVQKSRAIVFASLKS